MALLYNTDEGYLCSPDALQVLLPAERLFFYLQLSLTMIAFHYLQSSLQRSCHQLYHPIWERDVY